jgi:ankyrin repeat protein
MDFRTVEGLVDDSTVYDTMGGPGNTINHPLWLAVYNNEIETVKMYLDPVFKIDINDIRGGNDKTTLLCQAVIQKNEEIVYMLLVHRANPYADGMVLPVLSYIENHHGWLPIHFACKMSHPFIIHMLLEKAMLSVNTCTRDLMIPPHHTINGTTPLNLAICGYGDEKQRAFSVALLLTFGASLASHTGNHCDIPMQVAANYKKTNSTHPDQNNIVPYLLYKASELDRIPRRQVNSTGYIHITRNWDDFNSVLKCFWPGSSETPPSPTHNSGILQ